MMAMRPPGFTTRHISLTAFSISTACSSDSVAYAASKNPSSNGSSVMEPARV
jgi:hypothetical protein